MAPRDDRRRDARGRQPGDEAGPRSLRTRALHSYAAQLDALDVGAEFCGSARTITHPRSNDRAASPADPLAGSPWSRQETVAGFVASPPNSTLIEFARQERQRCGSGRALDIGCGAGRNAIPLAAEGWHVAGTDLSLPMLQAAVERAHRDGVDGRVCFALAPMGSLPVAAGSCDLVIAHGIWNLAPSSAIFRLAVSEAARVAKAGAALFVFTFSRNTLAPEATPIAGEPFVFTDFSGEPQCFLTADELVSELAAAGFERDRLLPLTELNRRAGPRQGGPPVIYQAGFRRVAGTT